MLRVWRRPQPWATAAAACISPTAAAQLQRPLLRRLFFSRSNLLGAATTRRNSSAIASLNRADSESSSPLSTAVILRGNLQGPTIRLFSISLSNQDEKDTEESKSDDHPRKMVKSKSGRYVLRKKKKRRRKREEEEAMSNRENFIKVAIMGSTNAGKSTLFNRFLDKSVNKTYKLTTDKRKKRRWKNAGGGGRFSTHPLAKSRHTPGTAIVSQAAGTTRDVRHGVGRLGGTYFELLDTAGVDGERLDHFFQRKRRYSGNDSDGSNEELARQQHTEKWGHVKSQTQTIRKFKELRRRKRKKQKYKKYEGAHTNGIVSTPLEILRPMMERALAAAQQAHVILLLFDARVGLTSDFMETCRWIRRYGKLAPPPPGAKKQKKQKPNRNEDDSTDEAEEENEEDGEEEDEEEEDDDLPPPPQPPRQRVVLLANKLEGHHWEGKESIQISLQDATRMGFGEPLLISALHGEGMSDIQLELEALQQEWDDYRQAVREHARAVQLAAWQRRLDEQRKLLGEGGDGAEQPLELVPPPEPESEEPSNNDKYKDERPLQIAILGRVNVGKSTLVNALLREERVITGATPGLTRDAIGVEWKYKGRPVQLVDTAGLRKPSQRHNTVGDGVGLDGSIEDMAVLDAMRALKVADVAVLVLDAEARMLQRHELAICQTVLREGRALVVVANKMDKILRADYTPQDFAKGVRDQLEARYPLLRRTPIVPISALHGRGGSEFVQVPQPPKPGHRGGVKVREQVAKERQAFFEKRQAQTQHRTVANALLPVLFDARDRWERRIPTAALNRWVNEVVDEHAPPVVNGRRCRIKFAAQAKGRPPTFLLFTNVTAIPDSYLRYLQRHFQTSFDMYGMDVRFVLKEVVNPYALSKLQKRTRNVGTGLGGAEAREKRKWKRLIQTGTFQKPKRRRTLKQRFAKQSRHLARYY